MLSFLIGLIDPVSRIAGKIADYKIAAQNATTDRERVAAEERVKAFEAQMQLAVTAAQHDKWWSTRELIGKFAAIYVFKIVVWDTVLGWGNTPDPGPQVTGIVMLVIGFYFGSKAATDIAGRILCAVLKR